MMAAPSVTDISRQLTLATVLSRLTRSWLFHFFLEGNDVFVCLPTGKSLCCTALPKVFDQLRVTDVQSIFIVSPLIALMKDQVAICSEKGPEVECVTRESSSECRSH